MYYKISKLFKHLYTHSASCFFRIIINYATLISKNIKHIIFMFVPFSLYSFVLTFLALPCADITMYLLQRYPNLATLSDSNGSIILNVLSKLPTEFQSGNKLGFWKRCIYHCKYPLQVTLDITLFSYHASLQYTSALLILNFPLLRLHQVCQMNLIFYHQVI